ncbi:hypothetical protein ACFV5N_11795 [Streptomyces sp. NPDC059853]|uniref:DUF6197 family protein n=1 Tax=Streptomyces sp. NPDC059853 TaxID=3346973 RepID=UPI00365736CA
MTPTHAPARPQPAAPAAAAALDLDARLALVDAAMTVRLETALVRLAVDAAEAESAPADADTTVLLAYAANHQAPVDLYPTPVAALLQRAARRLEDTGWCRGATRDASGATCLYGAVHAEARGSRGLEADGLDVLLVAIQRRFAAAATIPAANDQLLPNGAAAVQLLDAAALLAHTHDL